MLLVDDHPLFRAGLHYSLDQDPRVRVVGEAGSSEEAMAFARRERPDLVLVDLRMPGAGGVELARTILAELPGTRVVVLTGQTSEESVRECVEAGVHGYLVKTTGPEALLGSLLAVLAGSRVFPGLAPAAPGDRLTAREAEVLKLLALGRANKQIGRALAISEKTVRNHVAHVYEKLGVHHRTEAVRYAIRQGLVEA